jgi:formyltetrahydrofolate deformylase
MGELPGEIALVVSNHRDANAMASCHKDPFHFFPLDALNKARLEDCEMELLEQSSNIDLIVLATCYMQILSPRFVESNPKESLKWIIHFFPAL